MCQGGVHSSTAHLWIRVLQLDAAQWAQYDDRQDLLRNNQDYAERHSFKNGSPITPRITARGRAGGAASTDSARETAIVTLANLIVLVEVNLGSDDRRLRDWSSAGGSVGEIPNYIPVRFELIECGEEKKRRTMSALPNQIDWTTGFVSDKSVGHAWLYAHYIQVLIRLFLAALTSLRWQ